MGKLMSGYVIVLLLLLATPGCATDTGKRAPMTLTGTVRLVGNAPFARIVLTTAGSGGKGVHDYLILGPLQDELRKRYLGQKVSLEGIPCASPTPQFTSCFEPARIVGIGAE
ncbi:MAG: hypothetical protein FD174_2959 [Geobacteraceae bacterium]|nr:MAG: hypothetical protein FD174_2959 [Geobacteraceae bacterium]